MKVGVYNFDLFVAKMGLYNAAMLKTQTLFFIVRV